MKENLEKTIPAGMFNAHRKPPAQYRFDDNMRHLRNKLSNPESL
jgi:hypothetical protein